MFKALIFDKNNDELPHGSIREVNLEELPEGDVLVNIEYSTINYKDGLAITSKSPIMKSFPIVPGIDFSGTVENSSNSDFKIGDKVVLNGFGIGEKYWGGYAQKARVNGKWLIKLNDNLSTKQAMAIGTAGYTAMLCIMTLEDHGVTCNKGEILVTGATGGVGSIAISILSKLGYSVTASTGRVEQYTNYLTSLGANKVIDRNELSEKSKPLGKETWAGAVDSVGSHTLANICAQTMYGGTVAACGLAQNFDLPATVMPFILRGVILAGVDSVYCPIEKRKKAWDRLSKDLDLSQLNNMTKVIPLSEVVDTATNLMNGKTYGRIIVDVNT